MQYRTHAGEELTENSFLIREQFDLTDIEQIKNKSKSIQTGSLMVMFNILLRKAGVRTMDHRRKRKEVARTHGFRKHYTTQMVNSKVNPEIREMLLGHKIGLASCYYRPTQDEMYAEYQKAIDHLTIDPANRLLKQVKILQVEVSRLDKLEQSLQKLEQKYKKG